METTREPTTAVRPRGGPAADPPAEHPNGQELVERAGTEIAALADADVAGEGDTGFEGTRLEERVIPFLRMAQGLSPQLNRSRGEYIPGLALGDMFNTVTGEHHDGIAGVEFVACWKNYHFGVWQPRDLGGGFRGMLPPDDPLVRQTLARMAQKYGNSARFKLPRYKNGAWSDEPPRTRDGNEAVELVETGQLYVLYAPGKITHDNYQPAIVSFTSTALPVYNAYVSSHGSKLWTQPNGQRREAKITAYRWRLATFHDKRAAGEFYNWKRIDLAVPHDFVESRYAREDPLLFAAAEEFFEMARGGRLKVADSEGAGREPGDDGDAGGIPF